MTDRSDRAVLELLSGVARCHAAWADIARDDRDRADVADAAGMLALLVEGTDVPAELAAHVVMRGVDRHRATAVPAADPVALDAYRAWLAHRDEGAELVPPAELSEADRDRWWLVIAEWDRERDRR